MGKATRSLSGASQKKYFRELLRATDGLTPEAAETLANACEREIAQVRVRLPIPERGKKAKPASKASTPAAHTASPAAEIPQPAATAFDPFAFSVVVVVTKEGREGLARKLQDIATIEDLKALAKAQHVAVPEGDLTADALRAAIVEGALQRVANRKAAAS